MMDLMKTAIQTTLARYLTTYCDIDPLHAEVIAQAIAELALWLGRRLIITA